MASTREVLGQPLTDLGRRLDLVVVDTDTGSIKKPETLDYVNVGIAECAAAGTAAGVAASGKRVLLSAFSAFAAGRAYEFIKLDIAYPNRQVCIAATHGGVSGGWLGPTHHALEDTILMGSLPNMTVVIPADLDQAKSLLGQALSHDGPTYLRLGRKASPTLLEPSSVPSLGVPIVLREGADVALVATGPELVAVARQAADLLDGTLSVHVVCVHSIAPRYAFQLANTLPDRIGQVVSLEESWPGGPLERLTRMALAEHPGTPVWPIQIEGFQEPAGHEDILEANHITPNCVASYIKDLCTTTSRGGRDGHQLRQL